VLLIPSRGSRWHKLGWMLSATAHFVGNAPEGFGDATCVDRLCRLSSLRCRAVACLAALGAENYLLLSVSTKALFLHVLKSTTSYCIHKENQYRVVYKVEAASTETAACGEE
jgi:hypothetical protein